MKREEESKILTRPEMLEIRSDGAQKLKDEYLPKESTDLYNPDIAPLPFESRNWSFFVAFWVFFGLILCIPSWMAPSGGLGLLPWWEVILATFIGGCLQVAFFLFTAYPGTIYGCPIAVLIRSPWGTYGARLPALLRTLVACGWAGVEWWIITLSIDGIIRILYPPWSAWQPQGTILIAIITWIIQAVIFLTSPPLLALLGYKWFNVVTMPIMVGIIIATVVWLLTNVGWENIIAVSAAQPADPVTHLRLFTSVMLLAPLIWADMTYGAADLTRHCKNSGVTIKSFATVLPILWLLIGFVGVITSGGATVLFGGSPLDWWNPVVVLSKIGHWWAVIALIAIVFMTYSTTVGINIVAGALNLANLYPKKLTFKRAGLIVLIVSVLWQPWYLLATFGAYVDLWLMTAAMIIAPVVGMFIADFYVIHKRKIYLYDLYRADGIYRYWKGWNPCAIITFVITVIVEVAIIFGVRMYGVQYYSFLLPLFYFLGFIIYYALMKSWGLKKYQPALAH